jgi:3-oxoacyl-[acyl-carrier protein] reductase
MANVIITGSSRGIGLELVKLFAGDGHRVLALSRDAGPVSALKHTEISSFPFDLSQTSDLKQLKQFLGREWTHVDVLINNAGALLNKPFLETTAADFRSIYEVNVVGLAEVTRLVLPMMPKNGHVVSISSMGGVQGSVKFPGLAAYSSSKGAVITLTELWAEEFRETGPSFNCLALGAVQTEMLEAAFPGYKAPVTALETAQYIKNFAMEGQRFFNGKVLQLSSSTP